MIVRRLALASALVLAPPAVEQGGKRTAPRLEPGNPSKLIRFERTEPVSASGTPDLRPVTWVSHSRPTIDAATAMLSQIGLSIEQGVGNICHSLEKEMATFWAKSLEPPTGTLATWLADVDAPMGRGMVTMQRVPPVTIEISSRPPSRTTSRLAIVRP